MTRWLGELAADPFGAVKTSRFDTHSAVTTLVCLGICHASVIEAGDPRGLISPHGA